MAKKRDKSIAIKVVELILAAFIVKGLGFVRLLQIVLDLGALHMRVDEAAINEVCDKL